MSNEQLAVLPGAVAQLKIRVEHWRTTRERLGAMPKEPWVRAGELARRAHAIASSSKRSCATAG